MDLLYKHWLAILLILLFGVLLGAFFKMPFKKFFRNFFSKAALFKGYWKFVIPFLVVCSFGYILFALYSEAENIEVYLSIYNSFVALFFAIFVGYFAFLQVIESRLDKYTEQGYYYIKNDDFIRAQSYYEKIWAIDSTDFSALATLLEIHLILQEYFKFSQRIQLLEEQALSNKDRVIVFYLKIAKALFQEDLGLAKSLLSDLISLSKDNPDVLEKLNWEFNEIKKSSSYKKLTGECRSIFDNMTNYLWKRFSQEQKSAFENADYTLSTLTAKQT